MSLEAVRMEHNAAITGRVNKEFERILTPDAVGFVQRLHEQFGGRIEELLEEREARKGQKLGFLKETKHIREGDWKVAPIPKDLQDRRVEITGPADRKMIINALNSGAKVFMADLEDSLSPQWENVVQGQINLYDAVRGTISFTSPEGKEYKLKAEYPSNELAVLIVRPRGWHLPEKHIQVNGKPIAGALMDFGLYFFHNAELLVEKGTGPYFYLPKLEHYKEAELWDDIFVYAQEYMGIPVGTIKATVLIETHPAAFQMDEILHALKRHIVAQNAGRWDYIFSYIKSHADDPAFICPDRGQVVMTQPFLRAYSLLLIQTCHKRGAFAMGGMSAFIPIKGDEAANEKAMAQVKKDKEREAGDGHDGTWVAHPGLIPVAMEAFDRLMPKPNQVDKKRDDVKVTEADLQAVPTGEITEAGIRNNIAVSLRYLQEWLNGNGCVPIFNLMEDAATAEISRTQLWQWLRHGAHLGNVPQSGSGEKITKAMVERMIEEECKSGDFRAAAELLRELVYAARLDDFLTLGAYARF